MSWFDIKHRRSEEVVKTLNKTTPVPEIARVIAEEKKVPEEDMPFLRYYLIDLGIIVTAADDLTAADVYKLRHTLRVEVRGET